MAVARFSEADDADARYESSKVMRDVIAPNLSCPSCGYFFKGTVYMCSRGHSVCSLCYTREGALCPAPVCHNGLLAASITNTNVANLVRDLREILLPVPCENLWAGCPFQDVSEDIWVHETECGFRMVSCLGSHCKRMLFLDLESHIRIVHKIRRDRLGWMLCDKDAAGHSRSAVRQMFVAGECFFARLEYFSEEAEWGAYVTVLAGNNVAHDFRVRMRMSSTTRDSALTYSGPVHSIDRSPPTIKDCFRISSDNLAYYNAGGRADFGPHNKGIDGRMALPIRVEVEKKKFGL